MTRTFSIGTRGSPLALAQAKFVEDLFLKDGIKHCVNIIKTTGDIVQDRPLYDIGGKALFSKEIERALLNHDVDMGVHSLKDLETPRPDGLTLAAFLPRADVRDVLVTRYDVLDNKVYGCTIQNLPKNARVGTSAPRRAAQLIHHRPDLRIIPLRGNVGTRLSKLDTGDYDAMVFAKAGLDRLNIPMESHAILSLETMISAAGQGIVALECRTDDHETLQLLKRYNDPITEKAARIERGYIERLEGASCRSAVGVYAHFDHDHSRILAMQDKSQLHQFDKVYPHNTALTDIWSDLLLYFSKIV